VLARAALHRGDGCKSARSFCWRREACAHNAIAQQTGLSRPTGMATRAAFVAGLEAIRRRPKRKRIAERVDRASGAEDAGHHDQTARGDAWEVRGCPSSRRHLQPATGGLARFDVPPQRVERFPAIQWPASVKRTCGM
jgi:hypothetical protein